MLESHFTRLFSSLCLCDGSIINSNIDKTASEEENKGSMSLLIHLLQDSIKLNVKSVKVSYYLNNSYNASE